MNQRNLSKLPSAIAVLLISAVLILGWIAAAQAQGASVDSGQATDGRAGTCYSYYPDPRTGTGRPYIPLARQAGSSWDRFDFSWPVIEPERDQWNFYGHDQVVQDLRAGGITNIVGILLWTPNWASTSGVAMPFSGKLRERPRGWYAPVPGGAAPETLEAQASAVSSPPKGLYEEWDDWTEADGDPANTWGRFVHTCVSHFGDRVKYWEMWNEPELRFFWTGTSADYARLLEVGYRATKAACPDCQVLFGGLQYWERPDYYKWVMNTLRDKPGADSNNFFFDILSVHLYSRSSTVYDVVESIRGGMTARVSDHPIWLTETGVPVWDDEKWDPTPHKYDYAATEEEAAAYLIQSYANAWAAGVERYFWFRTHDADMVEYFGLLRNDRSERPAYAAFKVATTYLMSPTMVTRDLDAGSVRRVILWGTPHGKVSVLWHTAPGSKAYTYESTLSEATLVDRMGVAETVEASGDSYALLLPGATANLVTNPDDYFIGGDPYVVIEEDTTPPSAASLGALPLTTYSDKVTVSWQAADAEAGIWGFDVQVREGANGMWDDWLGLWETEEQWSADFMGGKDGTVYCFRARAWDRAGNPGAWSPGEDCTTVSLERDVHLNLGPVFGDEDDDGIWETEAGESALDGNTFRLLDKDGVQVLPAGSGVSWEVSGTVQVGAYAVVIEPQGWPSRPPGWLPRQIPVNVRGGAEPLTVVHSPLGLVPHRTSSYLPWVSAKRQ